MSQVIRIAIDVMGGDFGPSMIIPAVLQFASSYHSVEMILVGDSMQIAPFLVSIDPAIRLRLSVQHASQSITMDDKPSVVLRSKKDSSIHVAMRLLKEGRVDAVVSAGNSGALMAVGKVVLKMFPGIDRPAMCAQVPDSEGCCYLLDLGANIDASAEQLYQSAVMGTVVATVVGGTETPRIGLLNVGEEEIKGNGLIRQAARLIAEDEHLNYIGYIEGDKIFQHRADVVICDGFTGNVVLKASEGVALLIKESIAQAFKSNWYTKIVGLIAFPVINSIGKKIDPVGYNGASLLGLRGLVVKSHGGADQRGFERAIALAFIQAKNNVSELIGDQLKNRSS